MEWSCQADLQLPGGGEPPPYGCMVGAGCVGPGLPGKFAVARRGHDPALRMHRRSRIVGRGSCPRRPLTGTPAPHPNEPHSQVCHCEPARTLVWQSVPLQAAGLRAPAGVQHWPGRLTGLTAGAMLRIAGERIATSLRSSQ